MIFVDRTGRRRRVLIFVGLCVGLLLVAGLVALTAAALVDPLVQPPWPQQQDRAE
jgi:hypothetical protein